MYTAITYYLIQNECKYSWVMTVSSAINKKLDYTPPMQKMQMEKPENDWKYVAELSLRFDNFFKNWITSQK